VLVVAEDDLGFLDAPFALDVDLRMAVHEDVGDRRILQQQLERSQPEQLVQHVLHDVLAVEQTERNALVFAVQQLLDDRPDLRLGVGPRNRRQPFEVQAVQQILVDPALQRLVLRTPGIGCGEAGCHWFLVGS